MKNNSKKKYMKSLAFMFSLMVCFISCQPSNADININPPLLSIPTGEVMLTTMLNENFTVNFTRGDTFLDSCYGRFNEWVAIKNRTELINNYKNIYPAFQPMYSNVSVMAENILVTYEYALAQECFSDDCSSKIRKEVLYKAIELQKSKRDEERCVTLSNGLKTGMFLMAIILVKERDKSVKIIDTAALQRALLFWRSDEWDELLSFSALITEYSEKFLAN
jgi:hypothetical protein